MKILAWFLIALLCFFTITEAVNCPAQNYDHASWPNTFPFVLATGRCHRGFLSFFPPRRLCMNVFGHWSPRVRNRCFRLKCPWYWDTTLSVGWPAINAGGRLHVVYSFPTGVGIYVRTCSWDGVWLSPIPYVLYPY